MIPTPDPLLARWEKVRRPRADEPAIFARDGTVARTFSGIEASARRWQERLRQVLPAGAVLAVQIGNDPAWPALLLAALRGGWPLLPLGQNMAGPELHAALELAGAGWLINRDLALTPLAFPPAKFPAPVPHLLKLTSGTTSTARLVRFRSAQLLADADQICATMGLQSGDLNFGAIPMSHSYGFSNLIMPLLTHGLPFVASEERLPRALLEDLARVGATVFPGMPVLFQQLVGIPQPPALPRLRLCLSAGAPLPAQLARAFHTRFGHKIHPFYGASECGGIAYDRSEELPDADGFVGEPLEGVTLRHGADGTLTIRSAAVGDGYFPLEENSALQDGAFTPCDLARSTPRGLVLTGRLSDVINIAGRKLHPAEVERCLLGFPGVTQAVVFGVPSRLRHEEAVACVATASPIAAGDLLRHCRETLSAWQVPKDCWLVDGIAANERGKISRRDLAARYLATRAAP